MSWAPDKSIVILLELNAERYFDLVGGIRSSPAAQMHLYVWDYEN